MVALKSKSGFSSTLALTAGCCGLLTTGPSQELRPIAVRNLDGTAGPAATLELRNALQRSNQFRIVPTPEGIPRVSGKAEPGVLLASLEGPDGRTLLKQKYKQEDMIQGARQLADDVVLALTKRPGIATSQIAFSMSRSGPPQVYLCDFDGDNVRQMTREGINVMPALGPLGARLAHVAVQSGNTGALVITDLTSGKSSAVTRKPAGGIEAAFSPDGKRIALSMSESGGPPDLYVARLSGLGRKPEPVLETAGAETSPSWSPDGDRLVFAAAPGPGAPPQIFLVDIDRKKPAPQPIPTGYASAFDPAWSPDGRRIAFVTNDRGRHRICVHELGAGTGSRPIASGKMPVWGADSRHLIFTDGRSLMMADSRTGRVAVLVSGAGKIEGLSWTR